MNIQHKKAIYYSSHMTKNDREARSKEMSNLVWWDRLGECKLFNILTYIKDINLEKEAKEVVSVRAKN